MNKITKLLFAFVTIVSFSLMSCEPDYVTDGSTVPSEAEFTITYYDNQGNVTKTEEYNYDKTNSQVSGTRSVMQDGATGESYTGSTYTAAALPNADIEKLNLMIFIDYNEPGVYPLSANGRNTARFFKTVDQSSAFNTIDDANNYLEVENYTIIEGSASSDMYFRSKANFLFYTINPETNLKAKVEGTISTNFKL